jgi:thiamine pyrophosphate-dependent acetolactate synthase large subunit-like protein
MRVIDAVAEVLKREGIGELSCFPTTPLIEAAAEAGIRPVICRQERVGVGIADGYARVKNGRPPGVFAMQYGPGAENAFPGVSTAYSDSSPVLLLPLGNARANDAIPPLFNSTRTYGPVTKWAEQVNVPERVVDALRRSFAALRNGKPGPALVELPLDIATASVDPSLVTAYRPVPRAASQGDPRDVEASARAVLEASRPIVIAGAGVLYAEASPELVDLAEYLQLPVMTTLAGKSAFPEVHDLALGSGDAVMSGPAFEFLRDADLVLAIGTSLTRHTMVTPIPAGKRIVQVTNEPADVGKGYFVDHAVVGDAKLVLRQMLEAARELTGGKAKGKDSGPAGRIAATRDAWYVEWRPKLTSKDRPINPYRVIGEFMRNVDPAGAIVTHDSGNPRYEMMPFYRSNGPRTYLGWGKSHQLGTGLGLIMGAKLADPARFCVNFMGDAAFGMTGLDFETAVRSGLPILTIVLNNGGMAVETRNMEVSHRLFRTRDLGGAYAQMALAMGGWAERVEDPEDVGPAILRARRATDDGKAALLEFITAEEMSYSHRRPFG